MAEISIEKDQKLDETPNVPCTYCRGEPKHSVLASIDLHGEEEVGRDFSFEWNDIFQIIRCDGCQTVTFRKLHTDSEDFNPVEPGSGELEHTVTEELYPSRATGRNLMKDTDLLPVNLQRIYKETIQALNSAQPVLTGIGIRAIVETVCKDKQAAGKRLVEQIDGLVTKGALTKEGAEILHKLRVLGNEAAHEVTPHDNVQLDLAIDVIEHLLTGTYVLPDHVRRKFK